jgi:LmbE family N-acetylglucosaminyl deacetylase
MTLIRTGLRFAFLALAIPSAITAETAVAPKPLHSSNADVTGDPANLKGERVHLRTGLELPIDQGAPGLQQILLKLRTRASLMMIVAHPDDEDGGMLTYEARGHGVRAAMLTLTRGEGGQNLMTGDFDGALGLIRTQELLAADRYFGTDQMFGTEVDFGFSKTKEEAFSQWTHERVLYDAVRAVRLYRPLVVTSVFVGGPTDGHGHHQVSGEMAQEVFTAAADPKVFPEMGLEPWVPLKVYARVPFAQASKEGIFDYATGKYVPVRFYNYVTKVWTDAVPHADVMIHEGEYSDQLGMSYVQFAREGLALQKTQIGAGIRVPPAGSYDVGYTRYGSRVTETPGTEKDFFDGIDVSLGAIATLAPDAPPFLRSELDVLGAQCEDAAKAFDPKKPAAIAPILADALSRTKSLLARVSSSPLPTLQKTNVEHELRIKQVQLEQALALSFGIALDATTSSADIIAGTLVPVHAQITVASPQTLTVKDVWLENSAGVATEPDNSGREIPDLTQQHAFSLFLNAKPVITSNVTRPYFSRDSIELPVYTVRAAALRNAPATPPALTAYATLSFRGVEFTITRIVHDGPQPLAFIPPVSLMLPARALVVPMGTTTLAIPLRAKSESVAQTRGTLHLETPAGWSATPMRLPLDDKSPTFSLKLPPGAFHPGTVTASANVAEHTYTEGFTPIGYEGLTRTNYFTDAKTRIVPVDLQVAPHLRVAYLPGTGDEVQSLLKNIGINATTLTVSDIAAGKLANFDTLLIGTRAYTAHQDLEAATPKILDFARNGGTVVAQYQAHAFHSASAPYPLTLSGDGDKVVEEIAKVQLSASSTGVLNWPNKITPADFDGWVEERGHGFPASWDEHYDAPTEVHDTDQAPQRGGLLVAHYGKGYYVYCSFALYRQLPEAVPGAYRLFANLLSFGQQPSK